MEAELYTFFTVQAIELYFPSARLEFLIKKYILQFRLTVNRETLDVPIQAKSSGQLLSE